MPVANVEDYEHGQMMGMLSVIQMMEIAKEANVPVTQEVFDKIKKIAVEDLSDFFEKPEEDIFLMVETQLKEKQS